VLAGEACANADAGRSGGEGVAGVAGCDDGGDEVVGDLVSAAMNGSYKGSLVTVMHLPRQAIDTPISADKRIAAPGARLGQHTRALTHSSSLMVSQQSHVMPPPRTGRSASNGDSLSASATYKKKEKTQSWSWCGLTQRARVPKGRCT
jgi:hypothetical protein